MEKLEKQYKYIYWDLDGTLWKHSENSIQLICDSLKIECDDEIKQEFLYMTQSFNRYFETKKFTKNEAYKIIERTMPSLLEPKISGEKFLNCWCNTQCNYLDENAKRVLADFRIKGKQNIVLTDWWLERQLSQMKEFEILDYMEKVYSAEDNYLKSNPLTIKRVVDPGMEECSIIIGDSLESDIAFANKANIDSIWVNPNKKENTTSYRATYEITSLEEVMDIIK
mgnify:FL=1